MKIGILLPRSNTHTLIGADFIEGFKTVIAKEKLEKEISIHAESIGFGGTEKEVYAKTEQLLIVEGVDILIGFIDEKVLELVKPLVLASNKLMIVVNPGANYPDNWIPQSNIITLNLQHALLCTLSGAAAASSSPNAQGVMASTFYDCGYRHLTTMVTEFQAMKGEIQFNYINDQAYNDKFDINKLTDFLTENKKAQTLLCVFDALPAALFYTLLNEYEGAKDLQLFVSPMMLEQKALANRTSENNLSVIGFMPWHLSVPNETNKQFVTYYKEQLKKEPTIFSLLGWEAGLLVKTIIANRESTNNSAELIIEKLKAIEIDSPRGPLTLDAATQYFLSPVVKCTILSGESQTTFDYNISIENEWEEFSEKETGGVVSGWTNTYLCY